MGGATSATDKLKYVMDFVHSFNATQINLGVDQIWQPTYNLINDFYTGKTLDFTDAASRTIL